VFGGVQPDVASQEDLFDWKASLKWVEVDLRGLPIQTVAVLVVGIR
jgi:hypothetical protein